MPSGRQSALDRDLRGTQRLDYQAGDHRVHLTRERLRHILERHHQHYYNNTRPGTTDFFDARMTIADVVDLIDTTWRLNRNAIVAAGGEGTFYARINGRVYKMTIDNQQIVQFTPYTRPIPDGATVPTAVILLELDSDVGRLAHNRTVIGRGHGRLVGAGDVLIEHAMQHVGG